MLDLKQGGVPRQLRQKMVIRFSAMRVALSEPRASASPAFLVSEADRLAEPGPLCSDCGAVTVGPMTCGWRIVKSVELVWGFMEQSNPENRSNLVPLNNCSIQK